MPATIEIDVHGRRAATATSLEDGVVGPLASAIPAGSVGSDMDLNERHGPARASTATQVAARHEIRCVICGYGAIVSHLPARCPMCCERAWELTSTRHSSPPDRGSNGR